jgi:hypothetical protein
MAAGLSAVRCFGSHDGRLRRVPARRRDGRERRATRHQLPPVLWLPSRRRAFDHGGFIDARPRAPAGRRTQENKRSGSAEPIPPCGNALARQGRDRPAGACHPSTTAILAFQRHPTRAAACTSRRHVQGHAVAPDQRPLTRPIASCGGDCTAPAASPYKPNCRPPRATTASVAAQGPRRLRSRTSRRWDERVSRRTAVVTVARLGSQDAVDRTVASHACICGPLGERPGTGMATGNSIGGA